jgi:ABC-2 type transport system permease protein
MNTPASTLFGRLLAVAGRVLRQLGHDHRFLALSLVVPLVVIFVVKIFIDSLETTVPDVKSPLETLQSLLDSADVSPHVRPLIAERLNSLVAPSQQKRFEPKQFAVPLGAFVVHLLTYLLCAIVLVRERTAQTLGRMFVNGYRQVEIIGGYVLAYTGLATLQSLLVLTELSLLFKLGFGLGTLLSIYLVIWLLAVTSVALGILVSNFARTEGQVLPFVPLVAIPSVLLSGIIISVDSLPVWAQWLSHITPLYYANTVIQELIKPDGALVRAWISLAALPLYGLGVLLLASRTLQEIE